jgi:hypothetical protein
MINANRDTSEEVLQQHKQESYERFRVDFANAVEQKLLDFEMTWEDLSEQLDWECTADEVKATVKMAMFTAEDMNDIAHVFSCEPYIILRPRLPWIQT